MSTDRPTEREINRVEFDRQAAALKSTNAVFHDVAYNKNLVVEWVPDSDASKVPAPILDCVVAVSCDENQAL